jgi:CheY-like chemotaxis protein
MAKRALIVEDDMILAMVDKLYLQKIGCEVVGSVTNGEDAIEAVKLLAPDFILMDIRIEGDLDGIETMIEIRKTSSVPVIYVSGNSEPAVRHRAVETNMFAFLVKPLDFDALKELINTI